jgi:hypothetical protein
VAVAVPDAAFAVWEATDEWWAAVASEINTPAVLAAIAPEMAAPPLISNRLRVKVSGITSSVLLFTIAARSKGWLRHF